MSTRSTSIDSWRASSAFEASRERIAALSGLILVTAASTSVLYYITTELGGTWRLVVHLALAIAIAWAGARYLTARAAGIVFVGLAVVSYVWYFTVVVEDLSLFFEAPLQIAFHTIDDTIAIATGESVLTIVATDTWAHSFAPAPVFLTWYFGFRRQYVTAATVGGATMLVFVISGDLGTWMTLIGTIGVVMTVGFGTIEVTDASSRYSEALLVLITAMAVAGLLLPLVPSGGALGPLSIADAFDSDEGLQTLEDSVVGAGDELEIVGEINMNPEVRYVVEREDPVYLRTGVYDLYTGSGWERTGESTAFTPATQLPDNSETVYQAIQVETETDRMPAAGQPLNVYGIDLSSPDIGIEEIEGAIYASEKLQPGDRYGVVSAVPQLPADPGTATVPDDIDERYLQLPETVPEELYNFTDDLLADADSPVEKALIVESMLSNKKGYTQDTNVPDGDLAAGFLFDMDAGYCTYFATTAVVMLRAADVPARMAVGYANGQDIDETTSVLRGMNSHAWVEVYVEDHGWVTFDPTPAADWNDRREETLQQAREDGLEGVDLTETEDLPFDHDPATEDEDGIDQITPPDDEQDPNGNETNLDRDEEFRYLPGQPGDPIESTGDEFLDPTDYSPDSDEDGEDDSGGILPDLGPEHMAVLGLGALGTLLGIRRYEVPRRARKQRQLRWHRNPISPAVDLHRSAERLEWAMSKRFRPRHPGETLRDYHRRFSTVYSDEHIDSLFEVIEQARYGGIEDREQADRARELADKVVDETVVFGGKLRPSVLAGTIRLVDKIL